MLRSLWDYSAKFNYVIMCQFRIMKYENLLLNQRDQRKQFIIEALTPSGMNSHCLTLTARTYGRVKGWDLWYADLTR